MRLLERWRHGTFNWGSGNLSLFRSEGDSEAFAQFDLSSGDNSRAFMIAGYMKGITSIAGMPWELEPISFDRLGMNVLRNYTIEATVWNVPREVQRVWLYNAKHFSRDSKSDSEGRLQLEDDDEWWNRLFFMIADYDGALRKEAVIKFCARDYEARYGGFAPFWPGESRQSCPSRERIPDDVKKFVWNRDGGACVKCGSSERLEFDHIIPLAMGGSNTSRNLQLLCEFCNRRKGAKLA